MATARTHCTGLGKDKLEGGAGDDVIYGCGFLNSEDKDTLRYFWQGSGTSGFINLSTQAGLRPEGDTGGNGDGGNDLLEMDGAVSDVSDATLLDGGDGFDTAVVNLGVPTGSAPTVVDQ